MSLTEVLIALAGISVSAFMAYLAFKKSKQADDTAVEKAEDAAKAQLYTGYGGLLERIDKDNLEVRRENAELRREVTELRERLTATEKRIEDYDELKHKLAAAEIRIANLLKRLEEGS